MRKIEQILSDWGNLIKTALVIVLVLWAAQLAGPLKSLISKEMQYQSTRNTHEERQKRQESVLLTKRLTKEAKALGKDYTPEKYFKDLKELYQKGGSFSQIQQVINNNIKKNVTLIKEMQKASKEFKKWNMDRLSHRDKVKAPTLAGFKSWTLRFYLRTLLLITIFYIIRMAQRKGILETILANKTKLILAIVFWPVYLTKYPYNVIREIRVEVELRRFKDLFRKLSPKELVFVREVASSSGYNQWLSQKRKCKHGLVLALTVTILINLLPSIANAQTITETEIISISCCEQIENDVGETTDTAMPAILEKSPVMEPLILIAAIEKIELPWESIEPDGIDYIPETSLFVNSKNNLLKQIAKGYYHERFTTKTRAKINP